MTDLEGVAGVTELEDRVMDTRIAPPFGSACTGS